jgi:hypothetical protein
MDFLDFQFFFEKSKKNTKSPEKSWKVQNEVLKSPNKSPKNDSLCITILFWNIIEML